MSSHHVTDSQVSTAPDIYAQESDYSEHSDRPRSSRLDPRTTYYATDLITNKDLTLTDIRVEKVVPSMLRDMQTWLEAKCRNQRCFFGMVDPRAVLKAR